MDKVWAVVFSDSRNNSEEFHGVYKTKELADKTCKMYNERSNLTAQYRFVVIECTVFDTVPES